MAGEDEPIAEAEAPIEAVEHDEPTDPGALPLEGEEIAELPNPDDDLEEFDWNGQKIKGPKGLKDGVLMQADYTRKTQEVAATRKELEDRAQQLNQQFQASNDELMARGHLTVLKSQMAEYANVNWNQLSADDPIGAQQHWMRYQTMKDQVAAIDNDLSERQNQRSQQAQQETAKRFEQTQEWAKSNLKGWSPETDSQVVEWAKSKGATNQNLLDAMSPMVYEMLYLARLGEQALTKKPAALKPAPIVEPLKVVAAKANPPARKNLADMDMDEYVAARRKQQGR
ncbi:hypothetical protein FJ973_29685 [Mesorhizobium sp. B2-1-3]|uniref:hypothetical protein n=1 Tax=Mesorhizobium sp. B2-1-3 TaxID=2589972 RepID=UPI00112B987D|nr:hypothetical protein [Mesorhizobium sp. B2-1-3]TPN03817.1 hypothetical protein FJ973_29685 [Mesorhizobium sp. B2-1-3]